ncbi:probable cytochrome P450 6a13 [Colletes gigas]|uniref:probable cytochrome P450 6a13 n=1 Tax=Colletes gigas TaxID=935657 RepID=UPI001C9A55BA|nr:probable cytochrome P450 6a13 [Colletes gigas]
MACYLEIFSALVTVLFVFYYYLTSNFSFWKDRGVPGPKPIPGFGNIKDVMLMREALFDLLTRLYKEHRNEPLVGIFMRRRPAVIVNDLELVKDVLIKDFPTFATRLEARHEKIDVFSPNLFNLEPKRWRPLRTRISPVFTSSRIKDMFPLILECSVTLEKYLENATAKGEPVECREIAAKFTTDTIGSCAFGINMNAISDEESEFRKMGIEIFATTPWKLFKIFIRDTMPWLYDILGGVIKVSTSDKFFTDVIADTIKYRKENNIVRPDFVNLLMELKNEPEKLQDIELTDTLVAAQAFIFFAAGFETSSTTMAHCLYEMALNPDMQNKVREEIKTFTEKHNGSYPYESVNEMKYLDKVFKETLRKYPPGTFVFRRSTKEYTFNGTKVSIPKKTTVFIPVYAIHHDPKIYPNPEIFDPERFTEDAIAARHSMAYLPFGDGPRNCIGARFAVYQTKAGLITMLKNYKYEICEKTMKSYVHDPTAFVLGPKSGIYLKISKVEN